MPMYSDTIREPEEVEEGELLSPGVDAASIAGGAASTQGSTSAPSTIRNGRSGSPPKMSIGFNKAISAATASKPGVDLYSGSARPKAASNNVGNGDERGSTRNGGSGDAAGFTIIGRASKGGSSSSNLGTAASSSSQNVPSTAASVFSIKGRSSSTGTSSSGVPSLPVQEEPKRLDPPQPRSISIAGSASASTSSASLNHLLDSPSSSALPARPDPASSTAASSSTLPSKPKAMPLPFRSKASALPFKSVAKSASSSSISSNAGYPDIAPAQPYPAHAAATQQHHEPVVQPVNAVGKGYVNPLLVPRKPPQHSIAEGEQYGSRRSSPVSHMMPVDSQLQPPSLSRRSSASGLSNGKGKGREEEDGEMEDDLGDSRNDDDYRYQSRSSRDKDLAIKRYDRDVQDESYEDDRRHAGHGGGDYNDSYEASYRSPGFNHSHHHSSSRHRDDRYSSHRSSRKYNDDYDDRHRDRSHRSYRDDEDRRRSSRRHEDDYSSEEDRHRHRSSRKRERSRSRSRSRDRERHSRREERNNGHSTWNRGSSYSPNRESDSRRKDARYRDREDAGQARYHSTSPGERPDYPVRERIEGPYDKNIGYRDKDFHDEPGAPRPPTRELAPRLSAASTPSASTATALATASSLPSKPAFPVTKPSISIAKNRKVRPPPPAPAIATPFFLPTPQPPVLKDEPVQAHIPDDADVEMEIDDVSKVLSPSTPVPPQAAVQARKFTFFGSSRLDEYLVEEKVGEGTFGVVHKARRKPHSVRIMSDEEAEKRGRRSCRRRNKNAVPAKSKVKEGDVVALKKIVMHNDMDGVPITALREIRILKSLNHPNVVPVVDMGFQEGDYASLKRGTVYMVFPYMAHDLAGLLENQKIERLEPALLKLYAKQLLEGTSYLHLNKILHRDMKAANLLISDDGVLQIADFGLARSIEDPFDGARRDYTNCVVTRWYRPPELLLGLKAYGRPIDMWGVGCVIGEMFIRHPIFTGQSDIDQLARICQMCGSINEDSMPGWKDMPDAKIVTFPAKERAVQREFSRFSNELADLMDKLLTLDPQRRLTADEALDHDWFWTDPLPAEVGTVKLFPSSHEYDKRKAHEDRTGHGGEKNRAAQEAAFRGPNQLVKVPGVHQAPQLPAPPQVARPGLPMHPGHHVQPSHPPNAWDRPGPPMMAGHLPSRPVHQQMVQQQSYANGGYPMNGSAAQYARPVQHQLPSHPAYPPAYNAMSRPAQGYPPPPAGLPHRPPAVGSGWSDTAPGIIREPEHKRRKLSPPRSIAGTAARRANGAHADSLGGGLQDSRFPAAPGGSRQVAGAYADFDGQPAGGAEPLDY